MEVCLRGGRPLDRLRLRGGLCHGTTPSCTWFGAEPTTWARRAVAGFASGARFELARRPSGQRHFIEETSEFRIHAACKPTSRVRNKKRRPEYPQALHAGFRLRIRNYGPPWLVWDPATGNSETSSGTYRAILSVVPARRRRIADQWCAAFRRGAEAESET
jgi:hypothetical protein